MRATDSAANTDPTPAARSFSVVPDPPPAITTISPNDSATGIARTAPIVAIFDQAMDKPSAQAAFSLKRTSDGAVVGGTLSWYGNALIFLPSSPLDNATSYTATVSTTAKDVAGNPLPAAKSWRFTTTTQPLISLTSPSDGATGIARTAPIVAIFDQAMDKPSAQAAFSLKRTSDGAVVGGTLSWYGNALIFLPSSPLANATSYTATVSTTAKDVAGNPLPAAKSWRFTTTTQPLISSTSPSDGATEMVPNSLVSASFDAVMDKPSAQAAFSLKRTSDGAAVSGSLSWNGNILIFKPNSDLAGNTQYTATVSAAAKDQAGNPLPAAKTWRFTTTNRPIIDSVSPADGATGVARSVVTVAAFNKAMDKPSSQAAFSLKRTSNGVAVSGTFTWSGNSMRFTPSTQLAANTQYTATLAGTAKDLSSNTLANPGTWRFTTGG